MARKVSPSMRKLIGSLANRSDRQRLTPLLKLKHMSIAMAIRWLDA
jgi:hypothetical protein